MIFSRGLSSLVLILVISLVRVAHGQTPESPHKIRILYGSLSRPFTLNLVVSELKRPLKANMGAPADLMVADLPSLATNPFLVTPKDFYVGDSRPYPEDQQSGVPEITANQAAWFDEQVAQDTLPDVFVIVGHQVISEGWHNQAETEFLFLPTLLDTVKKNPSAKKFFEHIRFPVLWGCNAMTNLEPHHADGSFMTPEEIKTEYDSGPAGRRHIIGSADQVNTLEFYRSRLAREYGPGMGIEHYEYTRDRKDEKCLGPGKYDNCKITNLERIMPDSYLWDNSHWYNYPYMMKRLFPNAPIVLGYSSASPDESLRVQIFQKMLTLSYADVDTWLKAANPGKHINNLIYPLIDKTTPVELTREIVKAFRKNWTISTYEMNRHRPSGSITPLFPDLDQAGILGAPLSGGSLQYGPYEFR